jgi:uncharacterized protein (UPF0332 family)
LALAGDDTNANPAMSHIVNAAIAFADALTALKKSERNQKDHQGLIKALRDAFGNELPKAQENHLGKILGIKDEVQYGARLGKIDQAKILLGHLERFAQWAEQQFL